MRLPYQPRTGIFPQHETFLDMEPAELRTFPEAWRPAWGRCPWERIIRLQIIKQPDVLLAMHLLAEEYTPKQLRANYDFYDPKTIHESSLGPVHPRHHRRRHWPQGSGVRLLPPSVPDSVPG